MGEVGIHEIFVTAYRVKYLRPPFRHCRWRSVETIHFRFDNLAQTGGKGGKRIEKFFIFHRK